MYLDYVPEKIVLQQIQIKEFTPCQTKIYQKQNSNPKKNQKVVTITAASAFFHIIVVLTIVLGVMLKSSGSGSSGSGESSTNVVTHKIEKTINGFYITLPQSSLLHHHMI